MFYRVTTSQFLRADLLYSWRGWPLSPSLEWHWLTVVAAI